MIRFLRSKATVVSIIAGICGILLILWAWELPPFISSIETTDNAYVKGFVTMISPQVAGNISSVKIKDYERVKEGQLLIEIDDHIFRQKVDQAVAILDSKKAALASSYQQEESAKADIRSAEAAFTKSQLNWKRVQPLTQSGVSSQSNEDSARADRDQASAELEVKNQTLKKILVDREGLKADVESAKAAVELAKIDLEHTKIYSPRDGRVGEVGAKLGQYVTAGTQLFAVVPDEIWIVANYKETQCANMKIGQPVVFSVDALNDYKMKGVVVRFSPAAGSEFAVLKPDNATGNFTKVAQRIPVRIEISPNQKYIDRLIPGMSVITHVDTSVDPEKPAHSTSD
ncbi:HlyD family secretion protein [uncultured Bartonella sp.]|uniref:HlyD family secretion protein n=1 Tax=uncultured Bartonella sp. TaxID=104108 RepID=UPI0025F5FB10|nr:HlyD family secretion protein [uncultured Bartonella sp.]